MTELMLLVGYFGLHPELIARVFALWIGLGVALGVLLGVFDIARGKTWKDGASR